MDEIGGMMPSSPKLLVVAVEPDMVNCELPIDCDGFDTLQHLLVDLSFL
jgi:hypothetical protein